MLGEKTQALRVAYKDFEIALSEFSLRKKDLNRLNREDEKEEQMLMLTRVIKKEVIDLADTMDVLAEVVTRQDSQINSIHGLLLKMAPEEIKNEFLMENDV